MSQQPTVQTRNFKRGEVIFSPGLGAPAIYFVQSGLISISILKEGCAQLHLVRPMQIFKEDALMTGPASGTTAIALKDTQVIEIPLEIARALSGSTQQPLGTLFKGLIERLKSSTNELRSLRMNRGAQPCHPDLVAKVFGVIFYTARYLGKKENDSIVIPWSQLKTYAVETFHEEETRLEEAIYSLIKLGYAEPRTEKPDSSGAVPLSEVWTDICFRNMVQIEAFFDFYQNYHFKGGYAGLLKTNDKATELTQALVRLADKYETDRAGMVTMPYKLTVDTLKAMLGKTFEAEQIFRLEQKGLMVKRTTTQDGGVLSLFKQEFEQMLLNWKVLKEVEQWNEFGFVKLPESMSNAQGPTKSAPGEEKETAQMKAALEALESWKPLIMTGSPPVLRTQPPRHDEVVCPHCLSPVLASQTYCSVCDSEIPKKAA
jgi:CRP-like cAMP-binding protein